jgi:hypothetical protein
MRWWEEVVDPVEDVQRRNQKIAEGRVPTTLYLARLQEWDGAVWIDRHDSEVTMTANKVKALNRGCGATRYRFVLVSSWPMPSGTRLPMRWRGTRR